MTQCSIIEFEDDEADSARPFQNSWGGAIRVWTALYDKYLKDPAKEYDNVLSDCARHGAQARLWQLPRDSRLHQAEKAVLSMTFDYAIIRAEHFARAAADLREFCKLHDLSGLCHLPAWAAHLDDCKAQAVGFHHTSVTECPWLVPDDDQNVRPYNLRTGTRHFEIYDELDDDAAACQT